MAHESHEGTVGIQTPSAPDRLIDNVVLANGDGVTVHRQRVAVGPVLFREVRDFSGRTDGNPVYVGYNSPHADTDAPTWVVHRRSYDTLNRLVDTQVAIGIAWSARTVAANWKTAGGD